MALQWIKRQVLLHSMELTVFIRRKQETYPTTSTTSWRWRKQVELLNEWRLLPAIPMMY